MKYFANFLVPLVLFSPSSAHSAFTDFDDLTPTIVSFLVGDSISSKGIVIDVVEYQSPTGIAGIIGTANLVGISGVALATEGAALDFTIPPGTEFLSLNYDVNGLAGMFINGVEVPESLTFSTLDGTTVGGVDITVDTLTPPIQESGKLILNGPISSFIIGGMEFTIDNVTIGVPEPATAGLLLLGLVCLLTIVGRQPPRRQILSTRARA